MTQDPLCECSFFIPRLRDAHLSDGELHEHDAWDWLDNYLYACFGAGTAGPGWYRGFYKDPDTGERVDDESKKYTVALPKDDVNRLRALLSEACRVFHQKCIYLSVAGQVEFVKPTKHEPP